MTKDGTTNIKSGIFISSVYFQRQLEIMFFNPGVPNSFITYLLLKAVLSLVSTS